ncbi:MAG TPA: glycosyltransferase [Thermosynechococcus sp. M46_R2017_013]|nr:glycosyltransferase [Thermosynechococcus sp. M46_R2017_013]
MKGHETFLQAAARLVQTRQDLLFVCVGGRQQKDADRLKALAASLGLENRVIWAGSREDMSAVYSALDIVSSSSFVGEGFANVIAEAMACERPCVVTDVGDSARIVGNIGEVVPPRNPDALAEAMARMLDRMKRTPDIGRQARARIVAEFSVERMVLQILEVIDGQY